MKKLWIIAGLFVFLAVMGWGQTSYIWNGNGDGTLWTDPGNWEDESGGIVSDPPGTDSNDTVTIGTGASVTLSASPVTILELTIASGSTLTLDADLEVSDVLTNNGTLELNGKNLTLTAGGTFINTGTVGLQGVSGQVTGISAPFGGTIRYYGNTSPLGVWVFGYEYENLIVDTDMDTAGALTVNGNAVFDVAISALSVTVDGTSTMSASVSTTGGTTVSGATTITGMTLAADGTVGMGAVTGANLTVEAEGAFSAGSINGTSLTVEVDGNINISGATTMTSAVSLTSVTGSVISTGAITGTSLTVNASGNITLDGANTAAEVSLTSTGTGNITYNSAAGVTATASATNGTIAITAATGDITVGIGDISGSGTIGLTATAGSVTGTGTISGSALNVSASGAITLDGANDAATVGLTSTGTGNITYTSNSAAGVTVTASAANGTIAITEAAGDITVGASGISGSSTIGLTATSGSVTLNGNISSTANTVTLAGNNITGTGTISGSDVTLTAGGVVNVNGKITTAGNLLVSASGAITLDGANTAATVSLTSTGTGNITYTSNSAAGVTVTAIAAGGNIAITEAAGDITVGSITTTGTGTVTLTADAGNISIPGGGIITTATGTMSLLATAVTGTVDINNTITSGGAGTEGQGIAAVYIKAHALTGAGDITLNNTSGEVCAFVDDRTGYTGDISRFHFHVLKHIVYSKADDTVSNFGLTPGSYIFHNSTSEYGIFTAESGYNIYIIDVGGITGENPNIFTTSGTGFIEFRGTYTADSVTLTPGSGGIRFAGSPVTITLGSAFSVTEDIHVEVNASIIAKGIELANVDGSGDLDMDAGLGGISSVRGNIDVDGTLTVLNGNRINFYGNVHLGGFTHNDSIIGFVGANGTSHEFKLDASSVGNVIINQNNTVTVNNTTINQDDAATLTLGAGSSLVLDGTASWIQGTTTPPGGFTNGFYGENGELTFNAGSTLETKDFYVDTAYTVTFNGAGNIIASGNVEINNTFNGGINLNLATIKMSGSPSTLKVADDSISLCNLEVNGETTLNSGNPSSPITFKGSVTINENATLNCGGLDIVMLGDWEQHGAFVYGTSTVEFGSSALSGHTYSIRGDTTWNNLACNESGATLKFSNYSTSPNSRHTVHGELQIRPASTITLTRDTNTPAPPAAPPPTPTSSFWYLIIDTDKLDIEYVNISYCFMVGAPIFEAPNVTALPYSSHWNVGWKSVTGFLYAYTEDSNHTGKIDRIRLQAGIDLAPFGPLGTNAGFNVTLTAAGGEDYTGRIRNYERVTASIDSIYILLNEDAMPYDTGLTFTWRITQNTIIKDLETNSKFVGTGDFGTTTDTAPPRITYALAVPGHNEIYFQVSEDITANPGGFSVDVPLLNFTGGTVTRISAREFKVSLGTNNFTSNQLASGITFRLNGLADSASPAIDLSLGDSSLTSPKYPQNYLYSTYVTVTGNPPAGNAYYPANKGYVLETGQNTYAEHRAADILISVPPSDLSDVQQHGKFFIWPVWARYTDVLVQNPGSSSGIFDFSGKSSLEKQNITLQSRTSNGLLLPGPHQLIYAFDVSEENKTNNQGIPGLWHPGPATVFNPHGGNPPCVNLFLDHFPPLPAGSPASMTPAGIGLYNYEFAKDVFQDKSTVEFFYHLNGTPDYLLAGRLDIADGASVPADWYRRIRPFSFSLRDVSHQRGSVSIFNNVINSEKRERVYLDYKLTKAGRVTVQVFTLDGSLVKALVRENQSASDSYYRVSWDGTNNGGRPVARGMYFIRIVAPDIDEIRKVMVIK